MLAVHLVVTIGRVKFRVETGVKMQRSLLIMLPLALTLATAGADAHCGADRQTARAPQAMLEKRNPLTSSRANLRAGKALYQGKGSGPGCALCHGKRGEGDGPLAEGMLPPPRRFSCEKTIDGIVDGQLFWVIRHGSPGTGMPAHDSLTEQQIWQVVLYLRSLASDE